MASQNGWFWVGAVSALISREHSEHNASHIISFCAVGDITWWTEMTLFCSFDLSLTQCYLHWVHHGPWLCLGDLHPHVRHRLSGPWLCLGDLHPHVRHRLSGPWLCLGDLHPHVRHRLSVQLKQATRHQAHPAMSSDYAWQWIATKGHSGSGCRSTVA